MKIIDRKLIRIKENGLGYGDVKSYTEEMGYDIDNMVQVGNEVYVYLVLRSDE